MPDKQLVLAVDDRQWAATIQAELAKCIGRPAAECSFESLIDHVGLETDGVVLLAPATATDVEAVRPLVHECYWQQWPVKVFLLPANDLVDNKELAGLLPYIAGQFSWPADTEATLQVVQETLKQDCAPSASSADLVRQKISEQLQEQTPSLIGLADGMALAATHDVHVLLTGETGTGKTYFARQIHEFSARRQQRLLVVACGSLVSNLVESELFGHARGSFTGAQRPRMGKLEAVGAGTLFLDEIDALGLDQQAKLLRAVETGEYESVGSNRTKICKARFLFASNVDLEEAVANGQFRKDLFYRINVLPLHFPPLRQRRQDVIPLARGMVARFGQQFGKAPMSLSADAVAALEAHDWPGNIRQLENVIQHGVLVSPGPQVHAQHLPLEKRPFENRTPPRESASHSLTDNRQTFERGIIEQALASSNNNRVRAASALGISRVTLYKKMKKYGLMEESRQAV
jgi:DNA-binding NtrC family response regulator